MDPKKLFADERLTGMCVFCGRLPDTRDHVPSKVLLDQPYPSDLPVVPSCAECNNGFSQDEPYIACMIECIVHGTTDPAKLGRERVVKILKARPSLRQEIERDRVEDLFGIQTWHPNLERIVGIVLKLARGHAAFECGEPRLEEPGNVFLKPFVTMSNVEREAFESLPQELIWPEIGSRAFQRAAGVGSTIFLDEGWHVIQRGRYRYLVADSGLMVRIVFSEYLACEVTW